MTANQPDQLASRPTADLPPVEAASSDSVGLSAEFRSAADGGGIATLHVALVEQAGQRTIRAQITGSVSDLYLHVTLPDAGAWNVQWPSGVQDRFIVLAIQDGATLDIGLAGKRRSPGGGLALPAQMAAALSNRETLTGAVELCTLTRAVPGQVPHVIRRASAQDAPSPPVQLSVTVVNGAYQLNWPAQLGSDADQNGEVNIADITPLGICLGAKSPPGVGWTLDLQARTDGDGNGEVNPSDLTALGQRYGQRLTGFVVEQSLGSAAGPGSWSQVGAVVPVGTVDRFGTLCTSLGPSRWQTLTVPAQAGWIYFRVTQVIAGAKPQPAGDPVLAPDVTPPAWPQGDQLAWVNAAGSRQFTFAMDAADDRGGTLDYSFEYGVDAATAPKRTIFTFDKSNAIGGMPLGSALVESPFDTTFYKNAGDGVRQLGLIEGAQYWVRVGLTDSSGNASYSDWLSFVPDAGASGGTVDPPGFAPGSAWDIWVNRQGDVRCTPPQVDYLGTDLETSLYALILPAGQFPAAANPKFFTFDEFMAAGAQLQTYTGGERLFPGMLHEGKWVFIGLKASATQAPDGEPAFSVTHVGFPSNWIVPLRDGNQVKITSGALHLPDGRSAIRAEFTNRDASGTAAYWVEFAGSSYTASTIEGLGTIAAVQSPDTPALLTYFTPSANFPETVSWFEPHTGVVAQVSFPPEVMYNNGQGDHHAVDAWEAESADTAVGVLDKVVVDPANGQRSLQIWEAHRDGTSKVRKYVPNDFLTNKAQLKELHLLGGQWVIEYELPPGQVGMPTLHRYCVLQGDSGWQDFDRDTIPTVVKGLGWNQTQLDSFNFGWPNSYLLVHGTNTATGEVNTAVCKGDLTHGLAGFQLVWHSDPGGVVDPAYPQFKGRLTPVDGGYFVPGHPGEVLVEAGNALSRATAWIGATGQLQSMHLAGEYGDGGPVDVSGYWDDGHYLPGFAEARLSPDYQWASPFSPGTSYDDPLVVCGVGEFLGL